RAFIGLTEQPKNLRVLLCIPPKFRRAFQRRSSMLRPILMVTVKPFAALRPDASRAARICELPYDVGSTEEARDLAADNPLSFFRVSKPEIDLAVDMDPYDERVYAHGQRQFARLRAEGALKPDRQPNFYLYRQIMGKHAQLGLVAVTSCDEY